MRLRFACRTWISQFFIVYILVLQAGRRKLLTGTFWVAICSKCNSWKPSYAGEQFVSSFRFTDRIWLLLHVANKLWWHSSAVNAQRRHSARVVVSLPKIYLGPVAIVSRFCFLFFFRGLHLPDDSAWVWVCEFKKLRSFHLLRQFINLLTRHLCCEISADPTLFTPACLLLGFWLDLKSKYLDFSLSYAISLIFTRFLMRIRNAHRISQGILKMPWNASLKCFQLTDKCAANDSRPADTL